MFASCLASLFGFVWVKYILWTMFLCKQISITMHVAFALVIFCKCLRLVLQWSKCFACAPSWWFAAIEMTLCLHAWKLSYSWWRLRLLYMTQICVSRCNYWNNHLVKVDSTVIIYWTSWVRCFQMIHSVFLMRCQNRWFQKSLSSRRNKPRATKNRVRGFW